MFVSCELAIGLGIESTGLHSSDGEADKDFLDGLRSCERGVLMMLGFICF